MAKVICSSCYQKDGKKVPLVNGQCPVCKTDWVPGFEIPLTKKK